MFLLLANSAAEDFACVLTFSFYFLEDKVENLELLPMSTVLEHLIDSYVPVIEVMISSRFICDLCLVEFVTSSTLAYRVYFFMTELAVRAHFSQCSDRLSISAFQVDMTCK